MEARGAETAHKLLSMRTEAATGSVAENITPSERTINIVLERQQLVEGQILGTKSAFSPGELAGP